MVLNRTDDGDSLLKHGNVKAFLDFLGCSLTPTYTHSSHKTERPKIASTKTLS